MPILYTHTSIYTCFGSSVGRPRKLKVVGSNPTRGSNFSVKNLGFGLCFVSLKYLGLYHVRVRTCTYTKTHIHVHVHVHV